MVITYEFQHNLFKHLSATRDRETTVANLSFEKVGFVTKTIACVSSDKKFGIRSRFMSDKIYIS